MTGRVAWTDENHAGIAFDESISAETLLIRRETDLDGMPIRAPRLKVEMSGLLRIDDEAARVRIHDVSQGGCRIADAPALKPGTGCEIALPGLSYRLASVRWFRGGEAGIMFHERLRYPDFAHWRHSMDLHRVGLSGR